MSSVPYPINDPDNPYYTGPNATQTPPAPIAAEPSPEHEDDNTYNQAIAAEINTNYFPEHQEDTYYNPPEPETPYFGDPSFQMEDKLNSDPIWHPEITHVSNEDYFGIDSATGLLNASPTPAPDQANYFDDTPWAPWIASGWMGTQEEQQRQAGYWNAEYEAAAARGDAQKMSELDAEWNAKETAWDAYMQAQPQIQQYVADTNQYQSDVQATWQSEFQPGQGAGPGVRQGYGPTTAPGGDFQQQLGMSWIASALPDVRQGSPEGMLRDDGSIFLRSDIQQIQDSRNRAAAQQQFDAEAQYQANVGRFYADQTLGAAPGLRVAGIDIGPLFGSDLYQQAMASLKERQQRQWAGDQARMEVSHLREGGDIPSMLGQQTLQQQVRAVNAIRRMNPDEIPDNLGDTLSKIFSTGASLAERLNINKDTTSAAANAAGYTIMGPSYTLIKPQLKDVAGVAMDNAYLLDLPYQFTAGTVINAYHDLVRDVTFQPLGRNAGSSDNFWRDIATANYAGATETAKQFGEDHPILYFGGAFFLDPMNKVLEPVKWVEAAQRTRRVAEDAALSRSIAEYVRIADSGAADAEVRGVPQAVVEAYSKSVDQNFRTYTQLKRTVPSIKTDLMASVRLSGPQTAAALEPYIEATSVRLYMRSREALLLNPTPESFRQALGEIWEDERQKLLRLDPSGSPEAQRIVDLLHGKRIQDLGGLAVVLNNQALERYMTEFQRLGNVPFPITTRTYVEHLGSAEEWGIRPGEFRYEGGGSYLYARQIDGQVFEIRGELPFGEKMNDRVLAGLPSRSTGPTTALFKTDPVVDVADRLQLRAGKARATLKESQKAEKAARLEAKAQAARKAALDGDESKLPRSQRRVSPDPKPAQVDALEQAVQDLEVNHAPLPEDVAAATTGPAAPLVRSPEGTVTRRARRPRLEERVPEAPPVTITPTGNEIYNIVTPVAPEELTARLDSVTVPEGTAHSTVTGEAVPLGEAQAEAVETATAGTEAKRTARQQKRLSFTDADVQRTLLDRFENLPRYYAGAQYRELQALMTPEQRRFLALMSELRSTPEMPVNLFDEILREAETNGGNLSAAIDTIYKQHAAGKTGLRQYVAAIKNGVSTEDLKTLPNRSRKSASAFLEAHGVIRDYKRELSDYFAENLQILHSPQIGHLSATGSELPPTFLKPTWDDANDLLDLAEQSDGFDPVEFLKRLGEQPSRAEFRSALLEAQQSKATLDDIRRIEGYAEHGFVTEAQLHDAGLTGTLEEMRTQLRSLTRQQAYTLRIRSTNNAFARGERDFEPEERAVAKRIQGWLADHLPTTRTPHFTGPRGAKVPVPGFQKQGGYRYGKKIEELLPAAVQPGDANIEGVIAKLTPAEFQFFLRDHQAALMAHPYYANAVGEILSVPLHMNKTGTIAEHIVSDRWNAAVDGIMQATMRAPLNESASFMAVVRDLYYAGDTAETVDRALVAANRARLAPPERLKTVETLTLNLENLRVERALLTDGGRLAGSPELPRRIAYVDEQIARAEQRLKTLTSNKRSRETATENLLRLDAIRTAKNREVMEILGRAPSDLGRPMTIEDHAKQASNDVLEHLTSREQGVAPAWDGQRELTTAEISPSAVDPTTPPEPPRHAATPDEVVAAPVMQEEAAQLEALRSGFREFDATVPRLQQQAAARAADRAVKRSGEYASEAQRLAFTKNDAFRKVAESTQAEQEGRRLVASRVVAKQATPASRDMVAAARSMDSIAFANAVSSNPEWNQLLSKSKLGWADIWMAARGKTGSYAPEFAARAHELVDKTQALSIARRSATPQAFRANLEQAILPDVGQATTLEEYNSLAAKAGRRRGIVSETKRSLDDQNISPEQLYDYMQTHYDMRPEARGKKRIRETVEEARQPLGIIPDAQKLTLNGEERIAANLAISDPATRKALERNLSRSEFAYLAHNTGLETQGMQPEYIWQHWKNTEPLRAADRQRSSYAAKLNAWLDEYREGIDASEIDFIERVDDRHYRALREYYRANGAGQADARFKNMETGLKRVQELDRAKQFDEAKHEFAYLVEIAKDHFENVALLNSGIPLDMAFAQAGQKLRDLWHVVGPHVGETWEQSIGRVNELTHSNFAPAYKTTPLLGTHAVALRDADWATIGPHLDDWIKVHYNFEDIHRNANVLRKGAFGLDNLGDLTFMSKMMRAGDLVGLDLTRFMSAAAKSADPYQAVRELLKILSTGSIEQIHQYAPYYLSSDAGRDTLRLFRLHGPTLLNRFEELTPKLSLGDLPDGVLPRIKADGTWTKDDVDQVTAFFASDTLPKSRKYTQLQQVQVDAFRQGHAADWQEKVLPLITDVTGAHRYDSYHVMNDLDPFLFTRKQEAHEIDAMRDAMREKSDAIAKLKADAIADARAEINANGRLSPQSKREHIALEEARIGKTADDLERDELEKIRAQHLDTLRLTNAEPVSLPVFFERIGAFVAELEGHRLAALEGKTLDQALKLGVDQRLMLGIKGNLAQLWMTAWPGYHVNNIVGNLASQFLGAFRSDSNYSVLPLPNRRIKAMIERGTSGEVGYHQSLLYRGRKEIERVGGETAVQMSRRRTEGLQAKPIVSRAFDALGERTHVRPLEWVQTHIGDRVENYARETIYTQSLGNHLDDAWPRRVREVAPNLDSAQAAELASARGVDEVESIGQRLGLADDTIAALSRAHMAELQKGGWYATRDVKTALRDYTARNRFDALLDRVVPVNYWTTRNVAFVGSTLAQRPAMLATVLATWDSLSAEQKDSLKYGMHEFTVKIPGTDKQHTFAASTWNTINPMIGGIAKFLSNSEDDWRQYEDMGAVSRILHLGYAGVQNAYASIGMRLGPQVNWFVTAPAHAIPNLLGERLAQQFGKDWHATYQQNVYDANGRIIHFAGEPSGRYGRIMQHIEEWTNPSGFRDSWLPLGGFEQLPTAYSERARRFNIAFNSAVYDSPFTTQQMIAAARYIVGQEQSGQHSHEETMAALGDLFGYTYVDGNYVLDDKGRPVVGKPDFTNPIVAQALGDLQHRGFMGYLSNRALLNYQVYERDPYIDDVRAGLDTYYRALDQIDYTRADKRFFGMLGPEARWIVDDVKAGKHSWDDVNAMLADLKAGKSNTLWESARDATGHPSFMAGNLADQMTTFIGDVAGYEAYAEKTGHAAAYRKFIGYTDWDTGKWVPGTDPYLASYLAIFNPTRLQTELERDRNAQESYQVETRAQQESDDFYNEKDRRNSILAPVWAGEDAAYDTYHQRLITAGKNNVARDFASKVLGKDLQFWDDQKAKLVSGNDLASYNSIPRHGEDYYTRGIAGTRFLEANFVDPRSGKVFDRTQAGIAQTDWLARQTLEHFGLGQGKWGDQFWTEDASGKRVFDQDKFDTAVETMQDQGGVYYRDQLEFLRGKGYDLSYVKLQTGDQLAETLKSADPALEKWREQKQAAGDALWELRQNPKATFEQRQAAEQVYLQTYGQAALNKLNGVYPQTEDENGKSILDVPLYVQRQRYNTLTDWVATLTPRQRDDLAKEFVNASPKDDNGYPKLNVRLLEPDQIDALLTRAQQAALVLENTPVHGYSVAGQQQPAPIVESEIARQQRTQTVYTAKAQLDAGAGLSPELLAANEDFAYFLGQHTDQEARAKGDKSSTGLSWNKLKQWYKDNGQQDMADYVALRIDEYYGDQQDKIFDAQRDWVTNHPDAALLRTEYPSAFAKYFGDSSTTTPYTPKSSGSSGSKSSTGSGSVARYSSSGSRYSSGGGSSYTPQGLTNRDGDPIPDSFQLQNVLLQLDPVTASGTGDDLDGRLSIIGQIVDHIAGAFSYGSLLGADYQKTLGFLAALYMQSIKKELGDSPTLADWQRVLELFTHSKVQTRKHYGYPTAEPTPAPAAPLVAEDGSAAPADVYAQTSY